MSQQPNLFDTLLRKLEDKDFKDLIEQERLRTKGYKLHFVIDANIIQNYCYPNGMYDVPTNTRLKLSQEYIEDEQITIQSILRTNKGDERVVFFNQYTEEFEGMIREGVRLGDSLVREQEDMEEASHILNSEFEIFREYILNHYSTCVAKVLLNINSLQKAQQIFTENHLLLKASDFKNKFLEDTATMCSGSNELSDQILRIAEEYWEKHSNSTIKDSKERDAKIIDRILSFNNYIQQNGDEKDKKHIFILLTDAKMDKNLFDSLIKNSDIQYPIYEGKKISLVRNTPQYFAYLVSFALKSQEKQKILETTVNNLQKLRDVNKVVKNMFREVEDTIYAKYDKELKQKSVEYYTRLDNGYKQIVDNYSLLRNQFENSGLLKSFPTLYDTFKNEIKNQEVPVLKGILKRVQKEYKLLSKDLVKQHSELLISLEDEAIFTSKFKQIIKLIRSGDLHFDVTKGYDHVEGSYHHLPVFLTFAQSDSQLEKNIYSLIFLVFDKSLYKSKDICNKLEETLFDKIRLLDQIKQSQPKSEDRLEIKLLKAFIFLILPSIEIQESSKNENKVPGQRANDQFALQLLNSLSVTAIENKTIKADLIYLLCWINRRLGKYEESLQYAEEGIKMNNADPRFHHGKLLAQFCLIIDGKLSYHEFDNLIPYLKEIRDLYSVFLDDYFSKTKNNILRSKITDTYHNSSCHMLSLKVLSLIKAGTQNSRKIEPFVLQARTHLDQLKQNGKYRDQLPEYYETEATLELTESYFVDLPIEKLDNALKAIDMAIELNTNEELAKSYTERRQDILDRRSECI